MMNKIDITQRLKLSRMYFLRAVLVFDIDDVCKPNVFLVQDYIHKNEKKKFS